MRVLDLQPLTAEAFAPFGEVIQARGTAWFPINRGTTRRYHALAKVETAGPDPAAVISLFRGDAFALPVDIRLLERHPLGSQCFVPMTGAACIIVVAPAGGDAPDEGQIRGFYARGDQGVNYARGTWHHPLVALGNGGDFVVIDRAGGGNNCDEVVLQEPLRVERVERVELAELAERVERADDEG